MTHRISILIPTMNRSEFVTRALNYYSAVGFKGAICLGDSSDEQHARKIQQAIDALKGRLNVIYRYFPSPPYTNDAMCLKELIEAVPTPYAVYSGDDDFVIPRTLEQCATFLDSHPDHSAAHGVTVAVCLRASGAHGPLRWAEYRVGHILESDRAAERWKGYMRHALSTQYNLHRTETWRQMYQHLPVVPTRYLGTEVLPCSFSAVLGKIKELDGLSCIFQVNDVKRFGWGTHSMYSLAMQPDWSQSVQGLRRSIVEEIARTDHIAVEEAGRLFDKEFWRHLLIMLQAHYDERYEPMNAFSAFKRRFPSVVAAVRVWRQIRSFRYRRISLKALLNPSHPYHADFMPAYQAIVNG